MNELNVGRMDGWMEGGWEGKIIEKKGGKTGGREIMEEGEKLGRNTRKDVVQCLMHLG